MARRFRRKGVSYTDEQWAFLETEAQRLSKLNHRSQGTEFSICEVCRFILEDYRTRQRAQARAVVREAR